MSAGKSSRGRRRAGGVRDKCELRWHLMHVASYGRALGALHPIIPTIYGSLDKGLKESQSYHTDRSYVRSDDPHFYLHAARRKACDELTEKGLLARLVDDSKPLNMSGILIYHRDFAVRVLHAQMDRNGKVEIPVPGHSRQRQDFWRQVPTLPGMSTDNLLMLWLDEEGSLVDPMILVRPLGGDHRRGNLRLEWRGKVTREMSTLRAEDLVDLEPDWRADRLA